MSIVTVVVLAVFVLPRFVVFFKSLDAKLPLPTRMLLAASSFVSTWWWAILLIVIIAAGVLIGMRRSVKGKRILDSLILRLPVIGDLVQTAILERVCRILSSMIRAGVDLPRSMTVTADSANNSVYHDGLEHIREEMMEGHGLAGPLARTGLFPGAAQQMFRVGEETGTLDQQLETAAQYYSRELEVKVERFTAMFEPAVIIFMGVVVGFVAVALVTAMYGIYNQVKIK
jgi:type IV pilus assembly protein PilC